MSECERFAAAVNAVLDGDAPASALADAHAQTCRDCRELASAARLLATAGPALRTPQAVPSELTPKLVRAMRRPRRRWAIAAGVAAVCCVLLARPLFVGPAGPDVARLPGSSPAGPTSPPARVADQWAAVSAVARDASAKATASARLLPDSFRPPSAPPLADDWNKSAALVGLEQATRATAEPVTGTAHRAVGLFLRDFGLSAKPAG